MKKRIVIRVDANAVIGFGHLTRCIALSKAVKVDFEVDIAIQEPSEDVLQMCRSFADRVIVLPETRNYVEDAENLQRCILADDIVVLDGHNFNTEYQRHIKSIGCKLVCIDDLHDFHFVADVIINRNPATMQSDYSTEFYTKFYFGFDYAMLRPEFEKAAREIRIMPEVRNAYICIGGADPHNITQKAVQAFAAISSISRINVVVGAAYKYFTKLENMKLSYPELHIYQNVGADMVIDILKNSEVAICPASTVAYEVFSVGLNLVTGYFVEDQKSFSEYMTGEGLAISVGNLLDADVGTLTHAAEKAILAHHYVKQKQALKGNQQACLKAIFEDLYDRK